MKFTVTFKDPDGVDISLEDVADNFVADNHDLERLLPEEIRDLIADKKAELGKIVSPWVRSGEYVTLEFNTEDGTVTVKRE